MPIDMDDAMRSGAVSARAAKKHAVGVKGPRAKPSEMTSPKRMDEGDSKGRVGANFNNRHEFQRTGPMPSKGARVNASYVPGPRTIDEFPKGKGRIDAPAGAKMKGAPQKGVPNTRAKGPIRHTGGPTGGNANSDRYYGGANKRDYGH